jgi:surfactin family lipopeptide synthetase A
MGRIMNTKPEVEKWLAYNNVRWLDGDELLYRLPPEGIDETMLEEMILHRAEMADSLRRYQSERHAGSSMASHLLLRQPLHRRFELYAQMNPGAVAIKFDHTELTYGELDSQSDGLAVLLQQLGFGPGQFCALYVDRSIATLRAILAVWKAGGAYLPLDPMLPAERIATTLSATGVRAVITQENLSERLPATNAQVILCGEDTADVPYSWPEEHPTEGVAPAYAICTFRATDRPSIVVGQSMDVLKRLESMQETSPIHEGDSVLRNTNCSLDVSTWELLWPLLHGARLVIPPTREQSDLQYMRQLISREHITVMHVVPTFQEALPTASGQREAALSPRLV